MTIEQIKLLRLVADAIIAGVAAAGSLGCPGGTLYAALMAQGCTLQQFEGIMAGLTGAGMLRQQGQLYFVTEKGLALAA